MAKFDQVLLLKAISMALTGAGAIVGAIANKKEAVKTLEKIAESYLKNK